MDKYGVIGYPLGHTFSPQIHNPAFKELGIDAIYQVYQINPDSFDEKISELKTGHCKGLNITVPYKQKVIPFLDEIDPLAKKVNAVNTIKKINDKWYGYNTDLYGFLLPIEPYLKRIKNTLVIGAGGAANAVCFALLDVINHENLVIANRTKENAQVLKDRIDKQYNNEVEISDLGNRIDIKFDLIVNTTSVGMGEASKKSPYDISKVYHSDTIVYDLIYNPERTVFLEQARSFGLTIINGLDMLIGQAAKSFFIWTGQEFPNQVISKDIFYK